MKLGRKNWEKHSPSRRLQTPPVGVVGGSLILKKITKQLAFKTHVIFKESISSFDMTKEKP